MLILSLQILISFLPTAIQINLFSFFLWGRTGMEGWTHSVVLKASSWLSAPGSIPEGLGDYMRYNPGRPHTRQTLPTHCTLSLAVNLLSFNLLFFFYKYDQSYISNLSLLSNCTFCQVRTFLLQVLPLHSYVSNIYIYF